MALDKTYKKQLEKFGIDFTDATEPNPSKQRRALFVETQSEVIKMLMDNVAGRHWLYSKLDMCRVFTSPFVPADAYGTAFFSGIQAVGQNLLDDIMRISPENFFLMIQEENARNSVKKED